MNSESTCDEEVFKSHFEQSLSSASNSSSDDFISLIEFEAIGNTFEVDAFEEYSLISLIRERASILNRALVLRDTVNNLIIGKMTKSIGYFEISLAWDSD